MREGNLGVAAVSPFLTASLAIYDEAGSNAAGEPAVEFIFIY